MARKSKAKYQVGEIVVIENPEVFVRCGYPIGPKEARVQVAELAGDEIYSLLRKLGAGDLPPIGSITASDSGRTGFPDFDKVLDGLAYAHTRYQRFGGNERRIHTRHEEELKGQKAEVFGWRFATTGDYYAPHVNSSWEGDTDYEPGGLENQRRHQILEVCPHWTGTIIEIEACHVRRLTAEEANQPFERRSTQLLVATR